MQQEEFIEKIDKKWACNLISSSLGLVHLIILVQFNQYLLLV